MPRFIIETEETVRGVYAVDAADEASARRKVESRGGIAFGEGIEQLDYMAFSVEARSAKLAEETE